MEHQVVPQQKLSKDEQRLLSFIPVGSERPRPLKELVQLTGWNQRRIRDMISRLIVIHHLPIGAVYYHPGNGYFQISNNQERSQALAPLTSQILMISRRAQIIGNAKLVSEE